MTLDKNILLNSNSGASLSFFIKDAKKFVKKKIQATERSAKSLKMQREYKPTKNISAVEVNKVYKKNDQICYEMEFINGYVSENYAVLATYDDVNTLSGILEAYFREKTFNSVIEPLKTEIIISKINEIESKCTNTNKNIKKLLKAVKKRILYCLGSTPIFYPKSEYHGDFTLSNIIFDKKEKHLYLIDFLDTYIDSYLVDYAKLLQDLKYCWSCRHSTQHVRLKAKILGERVINNIQFRELRDYKEILEIISLLNTLRILPYVNDDITLLWVEKTLKLQLG